MSLSPSRHARAGVAALTVLVSVCACEDTSPTQSEACAAGGGVCMSGGCADALPQYDCGDGQYCCRATKPAGDGGR